MPSFLEREIPEAKRGARLPPKGSVSRSSHLPERPIVREWAAFPCSLRSSPRPHAVPAASQACSRDDAVFYETFVDTSRLQLPLLNTTLDAQGGLRLTTNGTQE